MELIVFLLLLPVKMGYVYTNIYVLFPRYLYNKRVNTFIVAFVVTIGAFTAIQRATAHFLIYPTFHPEALKFGFLCVSCLIYGFFSLFSVMAFAGVIHIFKKWLQDRQSAQLLEKKRIEAELKFLRAQIHPHFLFNTLNNLYALTLKKSDKAPELVLKLSDMLNYMLYECVEETIDLEKEIEQIKNYVELEKLRYGDKRFNLELNLPPSIPKIKIAPLLFITFVENAFKHGLSDTLKDGFININLKVVDDHLNFYIENNKPAQKRHNNKESFREGIGLRNVKRRLELQYKDNYELEIKDEQDKFAIDLTLKYAA